MPIILVVDDSEETRTLLSQQLMCRGFEVIVAMNGVEGVQKALTESPDLILMDMQMPELNGWEAARKIRTNDATAKIPIIAVTGHTLQEDQHRALEAGCLIAHTKPIELEKLVLEIESLLRMPCA